MFVGTNKKTTSTARPHMSMVQAARAVIAQAVRPQVPNYIEDTFRRLTQRVPADSREKARTLEALNRWAVENDENQKIIANRGLLPQYIECLKPESSPPEQKAAVKGLWMMAFACRGLLHHDPGCMKALKDLSVKGSDAEVRRGAQGALWVLETETGALQPPIRTSRQRTGGPPEGVSVLPHIFISYKWESHEMVRWIAELLKKDSYEIYVDLENSDGSSLETVGTGVEKAAVVLICFSPTYKQSPNCRAEAEYTVQQKKPIIPLKMDSHYSPDGWLGPLIGDKVSYNFSEPRLLHESYSSLRKALKPYVRTNQKSSISCTLS